MEWSYCLYRLGKREVLFSIGIIVYVVKIFQKRKFIKVLFSRDNSSLKEEYKGKNDLLALKVCNIFLFLFVLATCWFWVEIIKDVPYVIKQDYMYVQGYTVGQSKGGADVPDERRGVRIKDEQTGEEIELTIFSGYIEENTYIEAEYLPNSHFGVIVSMKDSDQNEIKRDTTERNYFLRFLIGLIVVMSGSFILGQIQTKKTIKGERSKRERIKKNMPEVKSLIERVKSVMQGEIILEDDTDYIKRYNFDPEIDKNIKKVDAEITIVDIVIKKNKRYIDARYLIQRKNEDGEVISYDGNDVRWFIKKNGDRWEIVDCREMDFY